MLRYAITDRTLFPSSPSSQDEAASRPSSACDLQALVARCAALAAQAQPGPDGIDVLLIREKDLPAAALTLLCRRIAAAVRAVNPRTRILVAGRADIALAAALDGVHLSAHPAELTPTQVRTLFPKAFLSVSCHTLPEIHLVRAHNPDVILFAPVFGKVISGQQVTPAAGLTALAEACRTAAPIPVLALGGITLANAPSCLAAGAAGIAGIRLFMTPLSCLGKSERIEGKPC